MYKSGSTKLVKNLNTEHILNLVRINPGTTAREISKKTGLQMSTVLYTLRALVQQGLVKDIGYGHSTVLGGKPPLKWSLDEDYGVVLGLEILSTEIRAVVMNFAGQIKFKKRIACQLPKIPEKIVLDIVAQVNKIQNDNNLNFKKILGLGIAIPGSIDFLTGKIQFSYTFGFKKVQLRSLLQDHFSFPVVIDNDANCGALGIKWYSQNQQLIPNILYLTINQNFTGMGAAFIIDHKLYRGAHGAAGEIYSYMPASTWQNFLKRAGQKYPQLSAEEKLTTATTVSQVVENAKNKDPASLFILTEVAKQISKKIIPIIDLFDPQIIVIGGDICEAEQFISTIISDRIQRGIFSERIRNVPIFYSNFGTFSVALGSTALIMHNIFNS